MDKLVNTLCHPADAKSCIAALSRHLLCFSPEAAEKEWAVKHLYVGHAPGQWFAVETPGRGTTYIQTGESGRFLTTRPEGVKDSDFMPIPEPSGPVVTLRDFLGTLCAKLTDPKDLGFKESVQASLPLLHEMDSPAQVWKSMVEFYGYCSHQLTSGKPAERVFDECVAQTREKYLAFQSYGVLAGGIMLMARVLRRSQGSEKKMAICMPQTWTMRDTVEAFLDYTSSRPNGGEWIEEASTSLQEEGENLLDAAAAAKSVGAFYGSMYESTAPFFGAYRGFEFLGRQGPAASGGRFKVEARVCDERLATAWASLAGAFSNSLDHRQLYAHRAKIELLRQAEGNAAAEHLATQYIQLQMFYPRFFEPYLLGKSEVLTLKVREG